MSLIGQILLIEQRNAGADSFICVQEAPDHLTLVKARVGFEAYKPLIFHPETEDGTVTASYDNPWLVRGVIIQIAMALTFQYTMRKSERFRVQAHRTVQMLKAAYELLQRPVPLLAGKKVEVVGPNDLYEVFVVLEDNGEFMMVATEEGAIVEVKKSDWIIGEPESGVDQLRHLVDQHADAWTLKEYLNRWTRHNRN